MNSPRPEKLIDPVCGMSVAVVSAEQAGLLLEYDGRTFAFCSAGCRRRFADDPQLYLSEMEAPPAPSANTKPILVIDEGLRRWYESCSCCLSEAYPEVKAQLDAEREAAGRELADAGICEVAEAGAVHEASHSH